MTSTLMTDYVDEVDSSFIEKVGFYVTHRDRGIGNAFVQMNGKVYRYDHVPFETYRDLTEAMSVGAEYHDFASVYGPAAEISPDAELEQIDETFRLAVPEDEPEEVSVVSEDQLTIDGIDSSEGEDDTFDILGWLGGLADDSSESEPLEHVFEVGYSDEEIRSDAVRSAATLLARRKATPEDVLDVAKTFVEFVKNGS